MAKHPGRADRLPRRGDSTPKDGGTALARLLDAPNLSGIVPRLAPETLHGLIRRAGLEACGGLVAAATPAQLASVLDLDLWRNARPGHDERFDPDRFGEWLELLADAGDTVAARIVASADENLVVAGLSRYVRVFDAATFPSAASIEDDPAGPEGAMADGTGTERELGGYLVRATSNETWDAIVALLLALHAGHHDRFDAIMRGCRRLSNSVPEVDGLDNLLTEPEQLMHDVALERERRRSQQGYSSPADARAFLHMARLPRSAQNRASALNPVAAAYFRDADDAPAPADVAHAEAHRPSPESIEAIVGMLAEAGLVPQRPRALLEGAQPNPSRLASIQALMGFVRDTDDSAFLNRSRELAFLANTLVAGCSIQSRSFTPQEASDAAVGVCNLGLELWPARGLEGRPPGDASTAGRGVAVPTDFLVDHDLVSAFEVGWAALHEDVGMSVARQLLAALAGLRCADGEIQAGVRKLRIELARQHKAGMPWRARGALEVIAILDTPAWASLLGLMDECPVLPAMLTATLEGRTGAVSATAFEFISTTDQIATVQRFMARVPDALRP
jgi:hypothetical protein